MSLGWRRDTFWWRGDVIKWRHLKKLLKFGMIHQISGRIHATELILVSFRTFSRTRITEINEYLLFSRRLTSKCKVTHLVCVTFHISSWVRAIRRNLGVYFHIFGVQDHNNDITNTAMLTVDLQIQGHAHSLRWPSISQAGFVLSERSRCLFPHTWGRGSQ